jgi:membrane protease YdiL (CAAX protease family)
MVYVQTNGGLLTTEAVIQDKTFVFLSILGVIPAHLVTIFAVWAIYTKRGRIPFWKSLEFTWPRSFTQSQTVLYCAVVSLLLLGVGYVISYFLGGQKTDLERVIESSYAARVVTASLALLTAPLVEEVIYRGLLYPSIEKVAGVIPAIVIVTVLFSGVHVPQYWGNLGVILVITMLSVALTIVRAMSKSLLPAFLIHTIFNGIQSLLLVFEPFFAKPENAVTPTTQAIVQFCLSLRHLF